MLPRNFMPTRVALLLSAALLAGCGLKGPLYLPDEDPADEPSSTQPEHNKATSGTEAHAAQRADTPLTHPTNRD